MFPPCYPSLKLILPPKMKTVCRNIQQAMSSTVITAFLERTKRFCGRGGQDYIGLGLRNQQVMMQGRTSTDNKEM